jgi:glycosyltransferase involved in cell wall biosynthesis
VGAAVIDEETGILVDGTRKEAVAAAVLRLLGAPDLAQAMGTAAEKRVRREFSYSRAAADLERVVTDLEHHP